MNREVLPVQPELFNPVERQRKIRDAMKTEAIADAKHSIDRIKDLGSRCPVCGQFVKRYKRSLCSSIALALLKLVRRYRKTGEWVHISEVLGIELQGGTLAKLRYWGLAEMKTKDHRDTTKRVSGMWRPTAKGLLFADNKIVVPRYVYTCNAVVEEDTGSEMIGICDALGDKWDYKKLMEDL